MLTCYVYSTKIGEISDISKCFENFVSQALGVLTRIYAAELRFNLNANIVGTKLYHGRIWFDIFNETIDTEKYNCLTIFLPYFDRCFFEFEPYYQELIYIKDSNRLFWQGEIWEKVN